MKNRFIRWIVRHQHAIFFTLLLSVSLLTAFFSRNFYQKQFLSLGVHLTALFQRGSHETEQAIRNNRVHLQSKKELILENRQLHTKITELEKALASRPNLDYYSFLDNQIKSHQIVSDRFVPQPVRVMARQLTPSGNVFVLSKGSSMHLAKNNPVVAVWEGKIVLAGRIFAVTPFGSLFIPLFNANMAVGARLSNGRETGVLHGSGDASRDLELLHIPVQAEETLHYGDTVITSGLNSLYPPGVFIGSVSKMKKNADAPGLKIWVKPFLNFSKMEVLYVLTQPQTASPGGAPALGNSAIREVVP